MLTRLMVPCTIIRRTDVGVTDIYGNEIPTEMQVASKCILEQLSTAELPAAGETSSSTWRAIFPAETDIDTSDGVIYDGVEYEVTGIPWSINHGARGIRHVEVLMRRVAGAEDYS